MPAEPKAEPLPESKPEPKPTTEPKVEPPTEATTEPKVEPAAETKAEPQPAPATPPKPLPTEPAPKPIPETKPRPEDENLFEAVSGAGDGWRALRRFPVGPKASVPPAVGRVEPATHIEQPPAEPDPKQVPRVPFDPAAETRRLRSGR